MAKARTLTLKTQVEVTGADKLSNLGKQLQNTGKALTKNYTLPLVAAGAAAVKFASDAEEATSKAQQVFTTESARIVRAADNMNDAFSAATFLDTAGTFGALLQNMGFVEKEAADLSLAWLDLAQDMASFQNVDVNEALGAVRSALAGEFEPLKRFGVMLNVATIEARALEMGLWDGTGAIDAQTRALVVNAEQFRQQPKLLGDFERTAGGVANSTKILAANFEDAAASLGKELLPFATEFLTVLNDLVKGFADLDPETKTWIVRIAAITAVVGPALLVVGKLVSAYAALVRLSPAVAAAWPKLVPPVAVGLAIGALRDQIHEVVNPDGPSFDEMFAASIGGGAETAVSLDQFEGQFQGWGDRSVRAMEDATSDLGDVLPRELRQGLEEAEAIAAATPGSLANSLRENIDDYGAALDELAEIAAKSVSDLAERQEIEGVLASKELTDALNSDSTRTQLLALELVNDLVADYELLAPGALGAGALVNPALRSGMFSNIDLAEDAGAAIVNAAGQPLVQLPSDFYAAGARAAAALALAIDDDQWRVQSAVAGMAQASRRILPSSEPKDPSSPFRGITKGFGFGEVLAKGILSGRSVVQDAFSQMFGTQAATAAVPAAGGGGGMNITNIYLQWDGEPPRGRDESEIVANLQRLSPLIGGKLAAGY